MSDMWSRQPLNTRVPKSRMFRVTLIRDDFDTVASPRALGSYSHIGKVCEANEGDAESSLLPSAAARSSSILC